MTHKCSLRVARWLALALWLALAGCAQLSGPRTVHVSLHDLDQKLADAFPQQKPVLEIFAVTLDAPSISTRPQEQRVGVALQVKLRNTLNGTEFRGRLSANFQLHLNAQTNTLEVHDFQLEAVHIEGVSAQVQASVSLLGSALTHHRLEGLVLYRLNPKDAARAEQLGYTVRSVEVTADGLNLLLVPVDR